MRRLALAAVAALLCSSVAAAPSLIVHGAKITTQDAARPEASALAVKDGKILAVGEDAEIRALAGDATRVIDAGGRRLIPGLNDSHMHPIRGGRYYTAELRWDGVPTLKEALRRVAEQARRTPPGQWVRVVGGWTPHQFAERRMPTPEELTAAAPDTPVFVLYLYSAGLYNRKGLEVLGITAETEAPPGGRFELGEDGQPTGRLIADPHPGILYRAVGGLGELDAEARRSSTLHFYRDLNRFGLTSVLDAGGGGHHFPADYAPSTELARGQGLPIRISYYLFAQTPGREAADYAAWTDAQQLNTNLDRLLEHGYTIEGAGENLVWAAGDYENFQAPRPDLDAKPGWRDELTTVVRTLVRKRWPIRIHATYDETIDRILGVFEAVHAEEVAAGRPGFDGLRWAIDHAETIAPAQIARIHKLGGGVMVQNRLAFAGEDFVARYGKAAARRAPPLRELLDAGLPVGAGTDGTRVSSYNPWLSLYWLVSGKSLGGLAMLDERNRLSRAEALRLYTLGSAWFTGEEGLKGRIAPGQFADFALLSADYFSVPEEAIRGIEADLTVTGGRIVHGAGAFAELAPALPPILPAWSPVVHYGGYYNPRIQEARND